MNEQLKTKLRIWAYERLWDTLDSGECPDDLWFEVDASIPELSGKIDVNIYYDLDNILRASAYDIVVLPNGLKTTNCETWTEVF